MGTIECSQPASKSPWDSQDFGDINMVLKWPIFASPPGHDELTGCCTKQNATINFYLANDDSRQLADLTHTKQFLCVVFTIIKFPIEIDVRFFFVQV